MFINSGEISKKAMVLVLTAVALLLFLGPAAVMAAQQEEQEKIPYYHAETRLVAIPVYVTGKDGTPVRGLTTKDFEVREGRRTCTISSVEFIDHMQATTDTYSIIPPESRRQFLLLFDLSFSNMTGVRKAQQAGYDFLTQKTAPNDLIAVATISGRGGIRLICPFGPSRAQAAYAISTLELANQLKFRDPAGFAFDNILAQVEKEILDSSQMEDISANKDTNRAEAEMMAMEQLRDALRMTRRANDKIYSDLIGRYVAVFNMLSQGLASLRGRKNIVLFSEGFDQDAVTGMNMSELANQSEAWSTLSAENVSQSDISVRQSQQDLLGAFQKVLREFSQGNTIFYVVDVSRFGEDSTSTTGRRNTQSSLLQFADETNGELYSNLNDLGVALDDIAEKTSVGYLVVFEPSKPGKPGEFRKVGISVKQQGVKVNHQMGYSFEKEYSTLNPAEKQLQLAEFVVKDILSNRIPFNFDAQVFDGNEQFARVPVIIEIPGAAITNNKLERKAEGIQLEVFSYLLSENNAPVDFFFDLLIFKTPEDLKKLSAGMIKYYNLLTGPPGRYKVKCIVRDSEMGMISANIRTITVPDFKKRELHFSGPVFIDLSSDNISLFHNVNMQAAGRREGHPVDYPYQWGQRTLAPSINPEVNNRMPDLMLVRCHGLNMSSGAPRIDAKFEVIDSAGSARKIDPEALFDRKQDLRAGTCDFIFQFRLAQLGLNPGQYRLRMKLTDTTNNNSGAADVPFVVPGR